MSTKTVNRRDAGQESQDGKVGSTELLVSADMSGGEQKFKWTQDRAYHLWEQAGRPDGDSARDKFWHAAEDEINASQTSKTMTQTK